MNLNYLSFEQPIAELEAKIEELQLVGNDNDLNIADEVTKLRDKSQKLTEGIYAKLTPGRSSRLLAILSVPMPSIIFSESLPILKKCTVIATLVMTMRLSVELPA